MFINTLKQYLAELEQTEVGGRSVNRLVLDVRSGKVELEFAEDKREDRGARLERYERNDAAKIQEWNDVFVTWERKHRGHIGEQDYKERVVKELHLLLASGFLVPDMELLNATKMRLASKQLEELEICCEYKDKFALLCDLVSFSGGYFCFDELAPIEGYLEDNHQSLSAKDIDAFLRFKTMVCLCYERTHKKEDFVTLSPARTKILNEILQLVGRGNWIAPASTDGICQMMKNILGAVPGVLNAEDSVLSAGLWKLLEQGKGNRVKVTMQNFIGYSISRNFLKEGSPAQNKDFFGNDDGYSNIDKGINENEMSNGFKAILPLLDKYMPNGRFA